MASLPAIRNPACVMRFWSSYFVALTALSINSCQVAGVSVTPASSSEGRIDQHGAVLEVVLLRHAVKLAIQSVSADRRLEEAIRHALGEIRGYRIEQAKAGVLRHPRAEHLLHVGHGAGVVAGLQFADEDVVGEVLIDDVDVRVGCLEAIDHLDVGGDEGGVIV